MKTRVREITVVGRYDDMPRQETIQTDDEQLKTRRLRSLIREGRVVPTKAILDILIDMLDELYGSHKLNHQLAKDLEDAEDANESTTEKYEGEIEGLQAKLSEKDDDITDLLDDLFDAHSFIIELTTGTADKGSTESE